MQIRYAWHADQQMARRGITRDDVRQCLENHPSKIQTRRKTQYSGVVRGRVLKIGVSPQVDTEGEKFVTTAMWQGDDENE